MPRRAGDLTSPEGERGGAMSVLRCDESVVFIRPSVTIGIVAALITRNNGEILPDY